MQANRQTALRIGSAAPLSVLLPAPPLARQSGAGSPHAVSGPLAPKLQGQSRPVPDGRPRRSGVPFSNHAKPRAAEGGQGAGPVHRCHLQGSEPPKQKPDRDLESDGSEMDGQPDSVLNQPRDHLPECLDRQGRALSGAARDSKPSMDCAPSLQLR